jgi:hypothetical protein
MRRPAAIRVDLVLGSNSAVAAILDAARALVQASKANQCRFYCLIERGMWLVPEYGEKASVAHAHGLTPEIAHLEQLAQSCYKV